MNVRERDKLYASAAGLSIRAAREYRQTPVSQWTTTADRRIGGSVRALERLAQDEDLSWRDWRDAVRTVMHDVREFLSGVLETVAAFAERLRNTFAGVLSAIRDFLSDDTVKEVVRMLGDVAAGFASLALARV